MRKSSSTLASLALAFCVSVSHADSEKKGIFQLERDAPSLKRGNTAFKGIPKGVPLPVPQGQQNQNPVDAWKNMFKDLHGLYEAFVPPCGQSPHNEPKDPNPS